MAGRVIDLDQFGVRLPSSLAVDTNLVVARLQVAYRPVHVEIAQRATRFFALLRHQGVVGSLPSVVCQEFFHIALRELYGLALPNYREALATAPISRRRFDWNGLYKLRPDLIEQFLPELEGFPPLFKINNLAVIQSAELAPLPPGRRYEDELLRLVGRYQLDTSDAALLLEAQRAGITSIATLDTDLLRAQSDFDIYTWL